MKKRRTYPRESHGLKTGATGMVRAVVRATILVGAIAAIGRSGALAQDAPATQLTEPSPGASALSDQASGVETAIAGLLQQRRAAAAPLLDLQIDLKILQRWLLLRAVDADDDAMRDAASLRVTHLQAVTEELTKRLDAGPKTLSSTQLDGLASLHQLTFRLPELKSIAAMDEVCKTVALNLINAAGPTPAETQNFPIMRPRPLDQATIQTPGATSPPADLRMRIAALSVSEPLRQALLNLLPQAADPKQRDSGDLQSLLSSAIDLCDVLQRGVGIDPSTKPKTEKQLTEALVLCGDVRTRSAGKARMAVLDQYRRSLGQIQALRLPPALRDKLAPAFLWAAKSIEHGPQVLEEIDRYSRLCSRYDALHDSATLPANIRKIIDPLQRRFATERAAFLEEAQAFATGTFFSPPPTLEAHVNQMTRLLDDIDAVEQLPHALQTLAAYKPRPAGGLDRRANIVLSELAGAKESTREQAMRFATDAVHLAQASESLTAPTKNLTPEIIKTYTRDRLSAVEGRRTSLVTDLASQLAAGRGLDRTDFARLQTLKDLLDALPEAASFETALGKVDVLNRWADWAIPPDRLKAITEPYREATAAAFEGFASDNSTPISRWPEIHQTYTPLIAFIVRDIQYADACAHLPTGLFADLSKLMTPMNAQPFATERFISFSTMAWSLYTDAAQSRSADAMLEAIDARLGADEKK